MDSPSLQELLASCRRAWAVEKADGPASRWPRLVPKPSIAQYCLDRQGMGVPEESLPLELASSSVCGWRIVDRLGRICLEPGCPEPVNEVGCRRHLAVQPDAASVLAEWTKLQAVLEKMATYQPRLSQESQLSQHAGGENCGGPQKLSQTEAELATEGHGREQPSGVASAESPGKPSRRPKWAPKLIPHPAVKSRS